MVLENKTSQKVQSEFLLKITITPKIKHKVKESKMSVEQRVRTEAPETFEPKKIFQNPKSNFQFYSVIATKEKNPNP